MTNQETVQARLTIKDKTEFEILFKTYYSSLCAYANSFLKDVPTSEDVVQEVMFKVWSGRNSLLITTSIQAYLFKAVRNGCLNVLKHLDIRHQYKERQAIQEADHHLTSVDTVVFSELQVKIHTAIDLLPMERKKVFILSRYEGLTYQQISEKLGISVKTVENQIGKALQFLRLELAEYLPLLIFLFDIFHDN